MAVVAHRAFAFDDHTISSTALALFGESQVGFTEAQVNQADSAIISVETNAIRYRIDGAAPTASVGHQIAAGGEVVIIGRENLRNLKMIRVTNDATIMVTLLKL